MLTQNSKRINFVSSIFTRNKGFTAIESSSKISHKNAVSLLNSFTPQGASPQGSIRITKYDKYLGVGYYWMEDDSTARISTFYHEYKENELVSYVPPLISELIPQLARGFMRKYFSNIRPAEDYPIISQFGIEKTGAILYSLLSGDNLLIVHPNQDARLKFITTFLRMIPSIIFQYNRFTSGCSELDGNENIVGLAELPNKYRSHKKLYLPLDTIFVDLVNSTIEGEGIKNSDYTRRVIEVAYKDKISAKKLIYGFFKSVLFDSKPQEIKYSEQDYSLINRIQAKLGLSEPIADEWIMF